MIRVDGFTASEASSRVASWAARGWVHYSNPRTKSSHLRRVCPKCFSGVRINGLVHVCAAGCGWQTVAVKG